ncbi:MAG: CPBP family intramembrane glutamic endopeptidase [Candidatus Norongarragalinales archaeon]
MLSDGRLTGVRGWTVRLDWISSLLVVTASLIFLYGTVFIGTEAGVLASAAITILVVGLTLAAIFRTVSFDLSISKKEFSQILTWTFISLGAVLAMNYVTPRLSLAEFNPKMFGVLIAVAETVFFQGFLLPWLTRLTHINILAVLLCAGAAAAFHFNVYGLNTSALLIVFGGFAVLNFATIQTQRLTPAMLGHSAINFLAG